MSVPSGDQVEIAFGKQSAVVVEVGAGLRSYSYAGHELLDGYGAGEMCASGRGQILAPWPNRIEDGSYEFEGRLHQLPLDELDHRNAIHGLVRWVPWRATERYPDRVVMELTLHPQPGYPFQLLLRVEYQLAAAGLSVHLTATNIGEGVCPYGAGSHPYLRLDDGLVNRLELQAPAKTVLNSNDRGIPVGAASVEGTEYDFRSPRPIGQTVLDHAFTDLERDADGLSRVRLNDPDSGRGVALWVDRNYRYIMLFTGDPLPDINRRSLAIEPMTCPPNAFRSGESLVILEARESFTSTWGVEPI